MNQIKAQSERLQVRSNLDWSWNHFFKEPIFHDVYSVNKIKKHYRWCLECVQKRLKNLAYLSPSAARTESAKHYLQLTSQSEETFAQKVAVAFAFSTAVVLVCFSAFVVF